jgi:hypothetical protein
MSEFDKKTGVPAKKPADSRNESRKKKLPTVRVSIPLRAASIARTATMSDSVRESHPYGSIVSAPGVPVGEV